MDSDNESIMPLLLTNDKESIKQFHELISQRILELLDSDPGLLFSYFYRLDIAESKIQQILSSKKRVDIITELANLVLERQIQRLEYKSGNPQPPIEGWDW